MMIRYQASKATKRGPFHAVLSLNSLTPGLTYRAVCGRVVRIHYPRWDGATENRCPRCARITAREAT